MDKSGKVREELVREAVEELWHKVEDMIMGGPALSKEEWAEALRRLEEKLSIIRG